MKHIIYCADGTWNGPPDPGADADIDAESSATGEGAVRTTNVWKLFINLAGVVTAETQTLQREQEKVSPPPAAGGAAQAAKYMHGVGDSGNLVIRALGGAFGAGVIARIVRGYTYISRNYQAGDAIHILGFSRGAYTARALAGMICTVGLLNPQRYDPNDKSAAYAKAYAAWLKARRVTLGVGGPIARWFTGLLHGAELWASRIFLAQGDFITRVPIQTVAVWDTVGSLGLPLYIQDQRRDTFSFVDVRLHPSVLKGFHAMALDERRRDFPVTRWAPRTGIEELWFCGCHSDVGGGYPPGQTSLSDVALDWMMGKLRGAGVRYTEPLPVSPDPTHYLQDFHRPWETPPFNIDPQPRAPRIDDQFHPTVKARWLSSAAYRDCWPDGSPVARALQGA